MAFLIAELSSVVLSFAGFRYVYKKEIKPLELDVNQSQEKMKLYYKDRQLDKNIEKISL
ncbi:hypothetical protein [Terrisporobacter sp.]|uniref:hypothetical protein n=1 Tax=Terrisporobacter sp. TaxID=1965305 RepID=UPI00260EF013|nr:hypothetical protein [Terrisporobacter sp.]